MPICRARQSARLRHAGIKPNLQGMLVWWIDALQYAYEKDREERRRALAMSYYLDGVTRYATTGVAP
jgi:hypothetical protein